MDPKPIQVFLKERTRLFFIYNVEFYNSWKLYGSSSVNESKQKGSDLLRYVEIVRNVLQI